MMARVIALHGSTGSGKSTLCLSIKEHLGAECLALQENFDELLATPSTDDDRAFWQRGTTVISASDNVTNIIMKHISPVMLLLLALTFHVLMGTVWPIVLLLIGGLTISRFCRWINSHILSKMWLYNIFLLTHRQKKSNYRWIWRDRTCLDVYAYCIQNKATSVPANMGSILLEQTNTTSVAILLDVPQDIIEKHLRTRIYAPTSSRSFAFATRLILLTRLPIQASIAALRIVEKWYTKMNVPVIKISELRDKLDCNATTGDIEWSKHSINVLLETIERAIVQRGPSSSMIDASLMPWQIVKNSRLVHI